MSNRAITSAVKHGISPASPGTVDVKVERVSSVTGEAEVVVVADVEVLSVIDDYTIVINWVTDTDTDTDGTAPDTDPTSNSCCDTILSIDKVLAANLPSCPAEDCTPDAAMPDLVDPCQAVGITE